MAYRSFRRAVPQSRLRNPLLALPCRSFIPRLDDRSAGAAAVASIASNALDDVDSRFSPRAVEPSSRWPVTSTDAERRSAGTNRPALRIGPRLHASTAAELWEATAGRLGSRARARHHTI